MKGSEKNRTIAFKRPESDEKDPGEKEAKEQNKKVTNLTNSTVEPKQDKKVEVKQ